jgi:hypothetical protein
MSFVRMFSILIKVVVRACGRIDVMWRKPLPSGKVENKPTSNILLRALQQNNKKLQTPPFHRSIDST